ncbi:MAG: type II toxin-antitoxin system ParD family antitoxin [Solimonas sp.]
MQSFEKLSITLPREMAKIIREKVSAGSYGSNSEVIREAMRGWIDREQRLGALDAAIGRGMADVKAGRVQEVSAVRKELRGRYKGKRG